MKKEPACPHDASDDEFLYKPKQYACWCRKIAEGKITPVMVWSKSFTCPLENKEKK
jgi:hypothetical protein